MMRIFPKVSIIMPTYNGRKTIKRSIESVLAQTFKDFELIIVDDGSEDNTRDIVLGINDPRIVYLKNNCNIGIQKSLNKGLQKAYGKYVARIDADDEWLDPEKLEKQINFLELNSDYVLVGTGAVIVDEKGKEIFRFFNPTDDSIIRKTILGKNCFSHPSVVFRKDLALRLGGYDESSECLHIEDHDLWLKLGTVGKFANLPIYGLKHTKSKQQISPRNQMEQCKGYLRLIRKYKKFHPGYWQALVRSYLRIFLYGWLKFCKIKYRTILRLRKK